MLQHTRSHRPLPATVQTQPLAAALLCLSLALGACGGGGSGGDHSEVAPPVGGNPPPDIGSDADPAPPAGGGDAPAEDPDSADDGGLPSEDEDATDTDADGNTPGDNAEPPGNGDTDNDAPAPPPGADDDGDTGTDGDPALAEALQSVLDAAVAEGTIEAYAFELGRHDATLLHMQQDLAETQQVPVASIAKDIAAVVIAALVDEGVLDLDLPIAAWFGADTALAHTLTLFELLTHTHGLRADSEHTCLNGAAGDVSLQQCALSILDAGTGLWQGFRYGAAGYQVAGAVAEAASGESWAQLVDRLINDRLDIDLRIFPLGDHPRIGGGLVASATDLARYQRALLARDPALLSAAMHAALRTRYVDTGAIFVPNGVEATQYAPGRWLDHQVAGSAGPELSAVGALGSVAWLDDDRGYYAVLILQDRDHETGLSLMRALRAEVLARVP